MRREFFDLLLPVAQDRSGRDQQGRSLSRLPFEQQAGDHLDGLAQTHIVRQTAVQPQTFEILQPGHPTLLIFPQLAAQSGRIGDRFEPALIVQLAQHLGQGAVTTDIHLLLIEGGLTQQFGQTHAGVFLTVLLPELQQLLHLVPFQFDPLAAKLHQRRFGIHQLFPFLGAHHLVTNRQFIAILHDRVQGEIAFSCRRHGFALADGKPDFGPTAPFRRPPGRHDDLEAGIFQHPGMLFQEGKGFL